MSPKLITAGGWLIHWASKFFHKGAASDSGFWLSVLAAGLPTLWVLKIHVNDPARVSLLLLLILGGARTGVVGLAPFFDHRFIRLAFSLFIFAFVFYAASQPILEVYLGRHGIDFVIFSQVIDSITRHGQPLSSLIGMEWRNFLSHHFTPYLYLPAILGVIGVPAYLSASLFHAAGVGVAVFFLGAALTRIYQYKTIYALLAVTLVLANPTFREGILFGIHDEIYALPFIGCAYFFFLKGKHLITLLALIGATFTKESMFLVAAAFGVMAIIDLRCRETAFHQISPHSPVSDKRAYFLYSMAIGYGLLGFISYAFLQPLIIGRSFDHVGKLVRFSDLWRPDWAVQKMWFLVFLGLPFLWYPLRNRRTWHLILPALPLIGFVMVSRFDEMWKPLNYYGVVPTFIIGFASVISFARSPHSPQKPLFSAYKFAVLISIAFCWGGRKPMKTIIDGFRTPWIHPSQLSLIPSEAKVIAGPTAALMLLRTNAVYRLWLANESPPNDFDFIVTLKSEESEIAQGLKDISDLCHEDLQWRIRCHHHRHHDLKH